MKRQTFLFLGLTVIVFSFGVFSAPQFTDAAQTQIIDVACNKYKYPWCDDRESGTPAGLVNNIYKIALGLAGAAAFGVLIYGAILYTVSAGNTSTQGEARKWMTGAILGVVLLLGAYLILYTINPTLVELRDVSLEKIEFSAGPPVITDEGTAQQQILAQGIRSLPLCQEGQSRGCVSFKGMRQSTVNEILDLETDMNTNGTGLSSNAVFITGGTECRSHAQGAISHCNGYKVDLASNAALSNYIRTSFTQDGERTDVDGERLPVYKNPKTNAIYVFEPEKIINGERRGAHWDVTVGGGGASGGW